MTGQYRSLETSRVLLVGETEWVGALADSLATETDAIVRIVPTADAALDAVRSQSVDCVVSEVDLADGAGIGLLRSIRAETATLPVLLCTAAGSEAIASEAVSAGASDYISLPRPAAEPVDDILARMDRAVRTAQRTNSQRERARQFDAIFHDDRTLTWVLDPSGSLIRVNERAREVVDAGVEELIGEPFWRLPWWPPSAQARADIRQVIETAIDGRFGNVVVTETASSDVPELVEVSAQPVRDERGNLVSVVVEGVDISDRVTVERELRASEALHRVTLDNMTDTVLITDGAGAFTYVCPNVHFIFGYTVAEIREMGSIDGLLGEDLFDRSELEDEGVLKNIECTATDRAGREHTLLVNVRKVSIQGGTLLYSCRDITKRKQRERALTTLQATAREFLIAETDQEIARHIVDDVPEVIGTDASAVYLFDAEQNELQPAASTATFERLHGPLPTVRVDEETLTSYSFVEDETLFFDDVHGSDKLDDRASGVRSAAYIPLGDHGVFVAASADVGQFDDVDRELADLLAASAEAALERVRRESRLREQDRELQQRNRQLSELNRVNEIIREIDQAMVQAETRAEIERAVCELLTDDDRFTFAWIGAADPISETVEPTAWAGDERGYLDSLSIPIGESGTEPAGRTAATRDVSLVSNVADDLREAPWRKEALARDYRSVMSVPLVYGDVSYGLLTVYAAVQDAFDELTRDVLVELGKTIASATGAITRKNAILTPSMTRVVFESDARTFVLARLAGEAGCTVTYQGGVRTTEAGSFVFVSFDGATAAEVEQRAADLVAVEAVNRISSYDEGGMLRLHLAQPFFALELADHGAVLRSAEADPGGTSLVVDVPEGVDVRHISRLVSDAVGDVALRSKRTLEHPTPGPLRSRLFDQLTDRQIEVVQTAYFSGFFESPRASAGQDVADTLGISPQAFYQHARSVQRTLFSTLFDDPAVPSP